MWKTSGKEGVTIIDNMKELPNDVRTHDQLALLPKHYLSSNPKRPLLLKTNGKKFTYSLCPLLYSVLAILIISGVDFMSYFSINTTEANYLIGKYSPTWNPHMSENNAAQFMAATNALAGTITLLGGILADGVFGDYWSIVLAVSVFYIPGFILTWLTTFPGLVSW